MQPFLFPYEYNNGMEYIIRDGHKYYEAVCTVCGKSRGYKRKNNILAVCRSCSSKKRLSISKNNPMYGKKHKDKSVFRKKDFLNVDYNDVKISFSKSGNKCLRYKQTCPQCNKCVGYRRNCDASRTCIECQHKNRTLYTKEHRRLRNSMKANLVARLKQRLINKNRKNTFDLLNYTVEDLKKHLEGLWEPWMNWDNYGAYSCNEKTWQIDHITPDSWFNYDSIEDEEFKECWALNNLQPKDSLENLQKGNLFKG